MKFLESFVKSRKTYTNITPRGICFTPYMPTKACISQNPDTSIVTSISSISVPSSCVDTAATVFEKNNESTKYITNPICATKSIDIQNAHTRKTTKQYSNIPISSSNNASSNKSDIFPTSPVISSSPPLPSPSPSLSPSILHSSVVKSFRFPLKQSNAVSLSSSPSPCVSASPSPFPPLSETRKVNKTLCEAPIKPCILKNKTETIKKEKRKNTVQEVDEVDKSFINLSSVVSEHFSQKQKMDEDDSFGCTIAHELRKIEEPRKTQMKRKIMKTVYDL